jgi:acyl transferase domain-containing protein
MQTLHTQGYQSFLEIGPKPTLLSMGQRCLPAGDELWLPSLRSGRADWQQMLESLATLYINGHEVDWAGFEQDYAQRKLPLPTYPFQRQRYWLDVQPVDASIKRSGHQVTQGHPLLGSRLDLAFAPGTYLWQGELDLNHLRYLADHRVQGMAVLPATAYMEMAMAAAVEVFGVGVLTLTEIENKKVLVLSETAPPPRVQLVLSKNDDGSLAFQVFSQPQRSDQIHKPNEPWIPSTRYSCRGYDQAL